MGLLQRIEKRDWAASDDRWYGPITPPLESKELVTPETALAVTPMWQGVNIIAGTIGTLPVRVYRERGSGSGRDIADQHPLNTLLYERPNSWQTPVEFFEMLQGHALLRGNAFVQIVRNFRGVVTDLIPLHPDRIKLRIDGDSITYILTRANGTIREFPQEEIMHLRGLGGNGIVGYSVIMLLAEAVGIARVTEKYTARFYANNTNPTGILSHANELSPEARDNIKRTWREVQGGPNQHNIAVLEEGMTWQQLGMTAEDAQLIATRQFSVLECSRILNIQPHMLNDLERATFSNVEQLFIQFGVVTIRPWCVRWEKRMRMDLLSKEERKQYTIKFALDGLLRGDIKTRYDAYAVGRQWGWLSADDVRDFEDLNPLPNKQGQIYLVPFNMMDAKSLAAGDTVPPSNDTPPKDPKNARAVLALLTHATGTMELPAPAEQRSLQILNARRRQRRANERLLTYAADQVVRRETNAVRRQITKASTATELASFRSWMDGFYADHVDAVQRAFAPVLHTIAEHVHGLAADEVGADPSVTADDMAVFTTAYVESFAKRTAGSSLAQLRAILRDVPAEDAPAAIQQRLDKWEEKQPAKLARRQATQSDGAFARETYRLAGVQAVRWNSLGSRCPLCSQLDGRTVPIGDAFVARGGVVDPQDGKTNPLTTRSIIRHPPLHGDGCDCMVSADVGPITILSPPAGRSRRARKPGVSLRKIFREEMERAQPREQAPQPAHTINVTTPAVTVNAEFHEARQEPPIVNVEVGASTVDNHVHLPEPREKVTRFTRETDGSTIAREIPAETTATPRKKG